MLAEEEIYANKGISNSSSLCSDNNLICYKSVGTEVGLFVSLLSQFPFDSLERDCLSQQNEYFLSFLRTVTRDPINYTDRLPSSGWYAPGGSREFHSSLHHRVSSHHDSTTCVVSNTLLIMY